jgi:hypothetical protein
MDFSGAINKIMPEINNGGNEPFIIYRDTDGYHADFTQNQYGETSEWVADAMEKDPLALIYSGKDFSQGSAAFVYDTVLAARVRAEFTIEAEAGVEDDDIKELRALVNFFEDNVGSLSSETTDYLAALDKPLSELYELCPSIMRTSNPDWRYSEDLAPDAIYYIEREIGDRLHGYPYEIEDGKHNIDGYFEKLSIPLAGRLIILAENAKADAPYMVCEARRDNPLGVLEYQNSDLMCDYIEAMRKFVDAADSLLITLEQERSAFGLAPQTLTTADCIPNGLNENLKGKVIVIKPEALAPEYHSAEYQIQICVGGFGASPDSRGNAVFCQNLYSGKESRFERSDVAGILAPARTPEWAVRKLMPPQKAKTAERPAGGKTSLLGRLDGAKAEAARQNAERKDKPAPNKKRGDMEVD